VPRTRILLVGLPLLLSDLVRDALRSQPDMEVVGQCKEGDLPEAVRNSGAEVVVLGLRERDVSTAYDQLLEKCPTVKVALIAGGGRLACVFLNPSTETIVTTVRMAIRA